MKPRQDHPVETAAAKAGLSRSTGYRIVNDPRLPSQRKGARGRRRADPLEHVFEAEVVPMLQSAPGLRPVAISEEIIPNFNRAFAVRWSAGSGPGELSTARIGRSCSDRSTNLGGSACRTSPTWAHSA